MEMIIEIINNQNAFPFGEKEESLIINAIEVVSKEAELSEDTEVSVTICDNREIREINREFRNIDKATDVLSFPMYSYSEPMVLSEEILEGEKMLGDIVISLEKAREQAEEYGHSTERELSFLTVHSMLHLLGYDHMEEDGRAVMREREEYFLGKMGQRR